MKAIFSIIVGVILGCSLASAETNSRNNSKVKEFYNNFPGSDANKNGVLTVSEMRNFIIAKVPSSATSERYLPLKRLLKKAPSADLNGNGVLTKTELIKYLR